MQSLHHWRLFCFYQRHADSAGTPFDGGRLIYNATGAPSSAVLPHPFAMVLTDFWVFKVTPVCLTKLFPSTLLSAFLTAVGLPAIARPADEKHQAATDRTAK